MSNIRMLVVNDFDDASVALKSGAAVSTLPASNLQIYNNSRIFRVTGSQFVLAGNFADIRLISAFVLWRHNFTAAAQWRLELFANADQTGAVVFDTGMLNAMPQIVFGDWDWRIQPVVSSALDSWATKYTQHWFVPTFARSYRITVSDVLNPAGQLDMTRIYMGRHYVPSVNFSYGSQFAFGSAESQVRTDDGGLFSRASEAWRKVNFALEHLSEADRPGFIAALRHVRLNRDWFVSLYPESGGQKEIEHSFACKFTSLPGVTSVAYDRYSTSIALEEC